MDETLTPQDVVVKAKVVEQVTALVLPIKLADGRAVTLSDVHLRADRCGSEDDGHRL